MRDTSINQLTGGGFLLHRERLANPTNRAEICRSIHSTRLADLGLFSA